MQHHKATRTLGRTRRGRAALVRGLAIALIEEGRITTTLVKAKELRPFIERLVTRGKTDSVAARRSVATRLGEPKSNVVRKLFTEIAPRYKERSGGYTRIVKMVPEQSGRSQAVIEFV